MTNGSPEQIALLSSGRAEAATRIQSGEGATFFKGAKKGLKDLQSLSFTIDSTIPDAEIRGSNVLVNPDGSLLTPDEGFREFDLMEPNTTTPSVSSIILSGADARAFGMLHEAGQ